MFSKPLSPVDLYWIGYFRADGHINKYSCATFSQAYYHPVSEFAAHINKPSYKVRSRAHTTNYGFYVIHSVSSVELASKFIALGVKSCLDPDIYRSKHFWRGMIDGDGCIGLYGGGKLPAVDLIATHSDAEAFQVFLEANLGVRGRTRLCKNMTYIKLDSNKAKYLVELLYRGEYSANLRKSAKAEKIMLVPWKEYTRSWRPPAERDEAEYSLAA